MKPTIKDVARLAQVSPSTVSRALQGNPRISQEVRQRVQRIARELDFHPNPMARSLVKRHSHIVGVLFPGGAASSMGHPFYPAVLQGMGQVAGQRGYHMLLRTGGGQSDAHTIRELADSGYAGGILLLAAQSGPGAVRPQEVGLPMVEVGHPQEGDSCYYVDNDNVAAGRTVTEYLLERGHRRILFLGYNGQFQVTVNRREGYRQALGAYGIPLREDWVVPSPFIQSTTDSARLAAIFGEAQPPTAVVSMDDPLSIGLISCLASLGLRVPEDVSVISFNNTQAGQFATPALTSVDVNPHRLGASAMELLLDVMEGKATGPTHIQVPFQLIQRDSVAQAPPHNNTKAVLE